MYELCAKDVANFRWDLSDVPLVAAGSHYWSPEDEGLLGGTGDLEALTCCGFVIL